jgi:hypothetical protein
MRTARRHAGVTPAGSEVAGAAADRHARDASLALAFAQPGDTLLYLLLPLHHAEFGVSLGEAGFLLAANRLVRIAGYGWVARYYDRRGPRAACRLAAIAALLATSGYALLSGVWTLLAARLLWGLAFAAMNIATQAAATAEPAGAARRSGRMRAIIAAGPVCGLLSGAVISQIAGPRVAFLMLAFAAVAAIPFALRLPDHSEGAASRPARPRFGIPAALDRWAFIQGATLDGLFVVGLSVLAAAALPGYATLAAGGALALRYLAEIALGPAGGALAERFGARRLLTLLSLATAAGLATIGLGLLWTGAVLIVILRGLIQPVSAPVAALENPGPQRVMALARMATWRDVGAGVGPLLAGALLPIVPTGLLYGGAAALLAISAAAIGTRQT